MKRIIVLALLLLAGSSILFAQAPCMLGGTVTDKSKQGIPAVSITAESAGKIIATTMTDLNGSYCLNGLSTGAYNVYFKAVGYITGEAKGVLLVQGKTKMLDYVLKASERTLQDVTVTSEKIQKSATRSVNAMPATGGGRVGYNYKMKMELRSPGSQYAYNNQYYNPSTETYKKNAENDFMNVKANPLSTLSIDVDRASYSNVRRFINEGQKPPADAVRIEEMINYFNYDYPQPQGADPIAIVTELGPCPWNTQHKLLHIGIQAKKINTDQLPPSNLVFLIDVSGSMDEPNKLPLVKAALKLLVDNLRERDKVSIVVYAGNAGLVLPPTSGADKIKIMDALDKLEAGGSTAGGAGIQLAYKTAAENFVKGGNNRVILATDGDFNVGVSNENELEDLITQKRGSGIFLTCLGFGMGNYKDSKMELLADKGNGNYAYIDNIQEAQKTLVQEFGGTLFTIAKDVKAQVEFNPARVQGYRLVGYENRLLNTEDFKDDKKDAGELGSGHTVTILYEIIPAGVKSPYLRASDTLKYQQAAATGSGELATVKFRYKAPDGERSSEMVHPVTEEASTISNASANLRFSSAVAMFGMLLKDSKYKGEGSYKEVVSLAETSRGDDKDGYRAEFIRLVKSVK